jgi:hypothetical protein
MGSSEKSGESFADGATLVSRSSLKVKAGERAGR